MLSNVANLPIALYFGMRIGQISFFRMSSAVERPYGSPGSSLQVPGPVGADGVRVPPRLRGRAPRPMTMREAFAWSADLGGGTQVGLVQAGRFRTDARGDLRAGAAPALERPRG